MMFPISLIITTSTCEKEKLSIPVLRTESNDSVLVLIKVSYKIYKEEIWIFNSTCVKFPYTTDGRKVPEPHSTNIMELQDTSDSSSVVLDTGISFLGAGVTS